MATNAYLERMNQLQNERINSSRKDISESTGVPIHRPVQQSQGSPSGVPTGEAPLPAGEDDSYKNSHFYTAFSHYSDNDPHFSGVMDEMTKLATGLREQVNSGYMPPQIARQRLTQFVGDTMAHFERQEPMLEEEQKQSQMAKLLGAMSNQVTQQKQQAQSDVANAPVPAEGISQQQAIEQQQAAQGGTQ